MLHVGDVSDSVAGSPEILRNPSPVVGYPFKTFLQRTCSGNLCPHWVEQTQSTIPGNGDRKPAFLPQDAHVSSPARFWTTGRMPAASFGVVSDVPSNLTLRGRRSVSEIDELANELGMQSTLNAGAVDTRIVRSRLDVVFPSWELWTASTAHKHVHNFLSPANVFSPPPPSPLLSLRSRAFVVIWLAL